MNVLCVLFSSCLLLNSIALKVNSDTAILYEKPEKNSKVVAKLKKDEILTFVDVAENDFYKVKYGNETYAYIINSSVSIIKADSKAKNVKSLPSPGSKPKRRPGAVSCGKEKQKPIKN